MLDSLDLRKQNLATKLKWGLAAAAALLVSPIIFSVVKGLIGLAIAGAVGMVIITGAPWLSQKLANFFLDLRKQDARDNPITNRERISVVNWDKLRQRKQQIEAMDAEVRLWENQINALPADERTEFQRDLATAKAEVEKQALAWKDAEAAQQQFDKLTEKVARKWKVAQTGLRIKALSHQDQEDRINLILAAESAESADRALATAFSSLDSIVSQAQANRAALPHNPSPVIDVKAVDVSARVPLERSRS